MLRTSLSKSKSLLSTSLKTPLQNKNTLLHESGTFMNSGFFGMKGRVSGEGNASFASVFFAPQRRFYSVQQQDATTVNTTATPAAATTSTDAATATPTETQAVKEVDLDSILKQDELKSIYEELDYNDDSHSLLSYLDPTSYLATICEYLHTTAGMPWWSAIALTGVALRLVASPLNIYNLRFQARASHHTEKLNEYAQRRQQAGNNDAKKKRVLAEENRYRKEHGLEFWRMLVYPVSQIPIFMSMFLTARHLLDLDLYPDIVEGGALWFTNLAEPTSYLGLPLATAVTQALAVDLQQRFGQLRTTMERQHKLVQMGMRWGSRLLFLFVAWWLSGYEAVYFAIWLPSALFQLVFTVIQITPQGRRIFKIPAPYRPPLPTGVKKQTKVSKMLDKITPKALVEDNKPKVLVSQEQARLAKQARK